MVYLDLQSCAMVYIDLQREKCKNHIFALQVLITISVRQVAKFTFRLQRYMRKAWQPEMKEAWQPAMRIISSSLTGVCVLARVCVKNNHSHVCCCLQ